eukprot:6528017-Heterocapsa_arctica.AAC.1
MAGTAQKGVARMPQAGGDGHGRGAASSTAAAGPAAPEANSATSATMRTTVHCALREPGEP